MTLSPESPGALLLRLADEMARVQGMARMTSVHSWAERIRAIASSLEGQAEDAARLEWLSSNCFVNEYAIRRQPYVVIKVFLGEDEKGRMCLMRPGHTTGVGIPSLRAAIDAARAAQQESESSAAEAKGEL